MSISIKDVVAVTGSPGLYQIIKSDEKALVVESIDENKKRQLIKGNMMVSKLIDVSIYTNEDSEPLIHILQSMQEKYPEELPVNKKSSKEELMGFLESVLPDFDAERVYPSNVKKLISWYKILQSYKVDLAWEAEEGEEKTTEADTTESKEKGSSKKASAEASESAKNTSKEGGKTSGKKAKA